MKKKDIITIIIIALILAAIVLLCFFFATNHRRNNAPDPLNNYPRYNNSVIISDRLYIDIDNDTLVNINFDLSEFGLGKGANNIIGNIDNSIIYFVNDLPYLKEDYFFKFNTITGQITQIEYESQLSLDRYSGKIYAYEGYLYYFAWNRPDDDDIEAFDKAVKYLCRIPINGGNEEVITEYSDRHENFCFIVDNRVITYNHYNIHSYDLKKNKMTSLWNKDEEGYSTISGDLQYYDGNLYFLAIPKNKFSVEIDDEEFIKKWGTTTNHLLISLNINTKKSVRISETPINSFYITKNKIYYIPTEYGTIEKDGNILPRYSSLTIYSCNLDGKNVSEVCTADNNTYRLSDIFFINDKKIYLRDEQSYIVVDTTSGETKLLNFKK